jgi:hypothetical protein
VPGFRGQKKHSKTKNAGAVTPATALCNKKGLHLAEISGIINVRPL